MKKVFIKQEDTNDCGFAVACMVINALQHSSLSIDEIKFNQRSHREQLSFAEIEQILNEYGVGLDVYEATVAEWKQGFRTPCILYCKNKNDDYHFVVCYEIKKQKFLLGNPAQKYLKWYSFAKVAKMYAGYVGLTSKKKWLKKATNQTYCCARCIFETKQNVYHCVVLLFCSWFVLHCCQ